MIIPKLYSCVLAVSLFALTAGAQTIPIIFSPGSQTMTTGLVGFATNQSARLTVLNLNPVSTNATPPANCNVQLAFFDISNRMFAQTLATNLAPQTGAILDVTRNQANPPGVTATVRAQIRGQVVVNPTPSPTANPVSPGPCSVMVTLEILDANQSTVSLTTDTRQIGGFIGFLPPIFR